MKEIYKIPKGQNVSTEKGVKYIDNEIKTFFYETEQVPETFEELKELCKDITVDLKLTKDGKIYCYEHLLAENRTPAQMWQIIKGLIGGRVK